ncbi:unnamed protein product, partial [Prorocentrum cordatum]
IACARRSQTSSLEPVVAPQPWPSLAFPPSQARGSGQVFLSRRRCAALLSAGLLRALPQPQGPELPDFSFDYVLDYDEEKVLCLLSYLWQVGRADAGALDEVVSFARRSGGKMPEKFWQQLDKPLLAARVEDGVIEDSDGSLQADFANAYLGGGVLIGGNVQEEIRFSVCPECLVGLLFCERMGPEEAITIVGAQQYSNYSGYGGSFAFAGPCTAKRGGPADGKKRLGPHIVALDALEFPGGSQYEPPLVLRELTKAYTACLGDFEEGAGVRREAFATGNWGCGVFGGDPQLKSMIQWLAASAADRQLVYFPCPPVGERYGDRRVDDLPAVIQAVQKKYSRCSELYNLLRSCCSKHSKGALSKRSIDTANHEKMAVAAAELQPAPAAEAGGAWPAPPEARGPPLEPAAPGGAAPPRRWAAAEPAAAAAAAPWASPPTAAGGTGGGHPAQAEARGLAPAETGAGARAPSLALGVASGATDHAWVFSPALVGCASPPGGPGAPPRPPADGELEAFLRANRRHVTAEAEQLLRSLSSKKSLTVSLPEVRGRTWAIVSLALLEEWGLPDWPAWIGAARGESALPAYKVHIRDTLKARCSAALRGLDNCRDVVGVIRSRLQRQPTAPAAPAGAVGPRVVGGPPGSPWESYARPGGDRGPLLGPAGEELEGLLQANRRHISPEAEQLLRSLSAEEVRRVAAGGDLANCRDVMAVIRSRVQRPAARAGIPSGGLRHDPPEELMPFLQLNQRYLSPEVEDLLRSFSSEELARVVAGGDLANCRDVMAVVCARAGRRPPGPRDAPPDSDEKFASFLERFRAHKDGTLSFSEVAGLGPDAGAGALGALPSGTDLWGRWKELSEERAGVPIAPPSDARMQTSGGTPPAPQLRTGHIPVLLEETLQALLAPGLPGTYVDGTRGARDAIIMVSPG